MMMRIEYINSTGNSPPKKKEGLEYILDDLINPTVSAFC